MNRPLGMLEAYKKDTMKDTRGILRCITTPFSFLVFMLTMVACDTQEGRMHGNNPMGMNNWNSTQTLIIIGIVCVVGFILWFAISRSKK